jgi:hypothetical protein
MLQDEDEVKDLPPDEEELAHQKEMDEIKRKYGLKPEEPEPAPTDTSGKVEGDQATASDSVEVADTRQEQTPVNWEERYKNAQSRMTQATQEAAQLRQALADAQAERERMAEWFRQNGQQQTTQTPPQDDEILSSLAKAEEEFDVKPIADVVRKLYEESKQTRAEMARSRQESQRQAAMSEQERHESAILAKHPDAIQVVADPEYTAWLGKQPPALRNIAVQATADDFNWLLDQYKATKAPAQGNGQQAAQAAKTEAAKAAAVPSLRGAPLNQRQQEGKQKVPFSKIMHLPNSVVMQRYPDEGMIDWSA